MRAGVRPSNPDLLDGFALTSAEVTSVRVYRTGLPEDPSRFAKQHGGWLRGHSTVACSLTGRQVGAPLQLPAQKSDRHA